MALQHDPACRPQELEPAAIQVKRRLRHVLRRIRCSHAKRRTDLPEPSFSLALNAVGESFVDALLSSEKTGNWWLDQDGKRHDCLVKRCGMIREKRRFLPGQGSGWDWHSRGIPSVVAGRLGDGEASPDHVLTVSIPDMKESHTVVVEQKLRFFNAGQAVVDARTYLAHLLRCNDTGGGRKKLLLALKGRSSDQNVKDFERELKTKLEEWIVPRKGTGNSYDHRGSVPQICFASIFSTPNQIHVSDIAAGTRLCTALGFLAPVIDWPNLEYRSGGISSPAQAKFLWGKVRLWIGLDELLQDCREDEVDAAWTLSIKRITDNILKPEWRPVRRRGSGDSLDDNVEG